MGIENVWKMSNFKRYDGELNGVGSACGEIEKLVDGCFSGKCYVLDGRVEGY